MELTGTNVLIILAEVSIGFAGFSAVVGALFHRRRPGDAMPFDEVRFLVMLEFSLSVLVFSLFPLALHELGIAEGLIWRIVSTVLGVFLVFHVLGEYFLTFRRHRVSLQSLVWPIYLITTIGNSVWVLILLVSVAGFAAAPPGGIYITCLLWLIVLSAYHFVRLAWLVAFSTD